MRDDRDFIGDTGAHASSTPSIEFVGALILLGSGALLGWFWHAIWALL